MKKIIAITLVLVCFFENKAQDVPDFPNPPNLVFSLAIPTNINASGKIAVSTKRHLVTNVSDTLIEKCLKWDNSIWITLLENEASSYVASMLLYQITLKDAFLYIAVKNEHDWEKLLKKDDMRYWIDFLRTNRIVRNHFAE